MYRIKVLTKGTRLVLVLVRGSTRGEIPKNTSPFKREQKRIFTPGVGGVLQDPNPEISMEKKRDLPQKPLDVPKGRWIYPKSRWIYPKKGR